MAGFEPAALSERRPLFDFWEKMVGVERFEFAIRLTKSSSYRKFCNVVTSRKMGAFGLWKTSFSKPFRLGSNVKNVRPVNNLRFVGEDRGPTLKVEISPSFKVFAKYFFIFNYT